MFSHTTKGQPYNTPLLERFLKDPHADPNKQYRRLIDFELLTDDKGKRNIGFGYYAGGSGFLPLMFFNTDESRSSIVAGVLESLSAMAQSHLENGIASPFLV